MLRSVIIAPDQELSDGLQAALDGQRVGVVRVTHRYPNMVDLVRFLRAAAPQVVFLSMESRRDALDVAARVEAHAPGTQVVAFNRSCDPQALLETMRSGIREFIAPPFEPRAINELVYRLEEAVEQRPPVIESTDALFAFLPAKAGVGTTTVAVNTALALAQLPETNVLLADFDLNCGLVGFMLRLESQFSVTDAAENAAEMDENLWPKLVATVGNVDVLPAGKLNPGFRIEIAQIRYLVEFARRNYKAICVDLSGLMEKYSIELLHEAKKIFMVVTPEIPSLHLARERINYLRQLELDGRVALILNRAEKRHDDARAELEKLFGMPVFTTLPNDYLGVHKSLTAGKAVSRETVLGRRFEQLAQTIMNKVPAPKESKRGFLEALMPRKKPVLAQG